MSELITSHNLGYLAVLFMVVMMVRGRSAGSFAMLLASLLLIGLAVGHVFSSEVFEDSISLMTRHGRISAPEAEISRANIVKWNAIVALLLGGIGINLFCSWLTAVPGSKLRSGANW